jgi:alkaline phosphatase D
MPSARSGSLLLLLLAACALGGGRHAPGDDAPEGIAVGDTTATSAVVWARCATPAMLEVTVGGQPPRRLPVGPAHDLTGRIPVDGLEPGVEQVYRVGCGDGPLASGVFRTAPPPSAAVAVRFAWSGDLGGQNVCRDAEHGYPIFAAVAARRPDFFVALGDMIYADDACLAVGALGNAQPAGPHPARALEGFRAHWRYHRADAGLRHLLASTTYYAVWDDHEVRDDFGPADDGAPDAPQQRLFGPGEQAYREWVPIPDGEALYRRMRWGRHVELFLLDTRSHRDANAAPDTLPEPKTLLGATQRAWLEAGLATSTATWKVVVSSVPMSIPTGALARDGWADGGGPTGFERELVAILRAAARARVRGLVWITTDVHFATGLRYQPFPETPEFVVHEFAAGPLAAGLFPRDVLDATLRPTRIFLYGPPAETPPRTFDGALPWFNFGLAEVAADGGLTVSIVDATGQTRQQVESAVLGR